MKITVHDLQSFLDAELVSTKFGHNDEVYFNDIYNDSRLVSKDSIFVATKGSFFDGHDHLAQAYAKTNLLVLEDEAALPENFHGVALKVNSSRMALAQLCKFVYSPNIQNLTFYGVTGTNGKTSTTYVLESLLSFLNIKVGVLGTNNHRLGEKTWESKLTTPGPIELHKRLKEMKDLEAKSIAMEVSSHALDQGRVDGLFFDVAIFTNLSLDHLDYHKDLDTYFRAKRKLFKQRLSKDAVSVVNGDDPYSLKIIPSSGKRYSFGFKANNDFVFKVKHQSFAGCQVVLTYQNKDYSFFSPLVGLHNIYNVIGAVVAIWSQGYHIEEILVGVKNLPVIPGRLESLINSYGINVFIDYAHTDDALKQVLLVLNDIRNQLSKASKIVTVFGCGGNRDKSKRPLMFAAAQEHSDIVMVTSDNPRKEDPFRIIEDILGDQKEDNKNIYVEEDRATAIKNALRLCDENDILLIAGKGHEDYQIIGDKSYPFSDHQVVREALGAM